MYKKNGSFYIKKIRSNENILTYSDLVIKIILETVFICFYIISCKLV